ncbi:MAG: endolytic transglycosylase MltG [Prevotella sp.]|nr:endolytic transglycosylase MltG [Prevotella sp.]
MKKQYRKRYLIPAATCLVLLVGIIYYYFFNPILSLSETHYIYIDKDDTIDSVYHRVQPVSKQHPYWGFKTLVRHSSYQENIRVGRYAISPKDGAFNIFRKLKNGMQDPLNLTIPSVRTVERLSAELSKKLLLDSATIVKALTDNEVCKQYDLDTTTIIAMFIPNTYDMYWTTSIEKLMDRMKQEYNKFWDESRTTKSKQLGMSPVEIITLASIVDEETANDAEKPRVAGMYYNRLKLKTAEYADGMPLQADPTIKFALKEFQLKRIYHNMLYIDSPYNTYKYTGLPPGPIRIPSVAGIDAVLNLEKHDYLYMCAKEDFSGTHNFAKTYAEHLKNAAKYTEALNKRGIK